MTLCSKCGQRIDDLRLGIPLTPTQVRIFDAVKQAGNVGISSRDILLVAYEGIRNAPLPVTIKAHIFMINEKLVETDYQILSFHRRIWRLVKVTRSAPAPAHSIARN